MTESMQKILAQYVADVHEFFGDHLKAVILYGSYARGDYRDDSDIDIMILVDLDDEQIASLGREFSDLTFEYNYENDLMIMSIVKNFDHFTKWLRAYPFYNNVNNEGVTLYAA